MKKSQSLDVGEYGQHLGVRPLVKSHHAMVRARNSRQLRDGDGLDIIHIEPAQEGDVVTPDPLCMVGAESDGAEERMNKG